MRVVTSSLYDEVADALREDNRWLALAIGDLRKILELARLQQQLTVSGRVPQSLAEHLAIFAALKAHDSDGVEAAMRTHLHHQRKALRTVAARRKSRFA